MLLEDAVEGTVVEGAAQSEDGVAVFLIPPGARAFQSNVADEAMGRFDSSRLHYTKSGTDHAIKADSLPPPLQDIAVLSLPRLRQKP